MRFELQGRRNEREHHHSQEMFEVRYRRREMRVLRRAGLSGHYLQSVRQRRLSRPTPIQAGQFGPYTEVMLRPRG